MHIVHVQVSWNELRAGLADRGIHYSKDEEEQLMVYAATSGHYFIIINIICSFCPTPTRVSQPRRIPLCKY